MTLTQKTLASPARLGGIGLHTGVEVQVEMLPAPPASGIVFVRTDIPGEPRVNASLENVAPTPRRTALASAQAEIHTVEHLLATLYALGITNLEVRLDAKELPGLDGSAWPYYEVLKAAGVLDQGVPAREIRVTSPIAVRDQDACVVALASPGRLKIAYTLDYSQGPGERSQLPSVQHFSLEVTEDSFANEIAPARTFVLEHEVDQLRSAGLGKGATTQNTLVLGPSGIIENELRFGNEFVRHKILDLIGDLYLTNCTIEAEILATRSGHATNVQLARSLLESAAPSDSSGWTAAPFPADVRQIARVLPHRYPFLLVDRVLEIRDGTYARGLKNVTINEEFFQGHFPGKPVMPGVLQVEAMAQMGGLLLLSRAEYQGKLAFLLSLERVKFRRTVEPGDQLILEAEAVSLKTRTAQLRTRATVEGSVAAEAEIRFILDSTV